MRAFLGVRFVAVLLAVASVLSVASMLLLYLVVSAEPPVATGSTLLLRPRGALPEIQTGVPLPLGGVGLTVRGYAEVIRKAKTDRRVARLLVRPGVFDSPFWAKVQELREAIADFKSSGKTVYAFLETADERQYYLASVADRIFLLPTSTLDLTGLASYEVFLRGTFDWIGTYPDFLHVGDYKSAVNVYTERTFTPAHREMSESINRDLFDQLVRAIADGRRLPEAEVRALVDRGPFLSDEALRVGLVDELSYEDEIDDLEVGLRASSFLEVEDYARVSWEAIGVPRRSRIAVVNAVGTIVSGRSAYDPVNGPVLGSDSIVEHVRTARADRRVKAIVLRIDSPGGSSVASDVIWRELAITRSGGLPVVVSMSDLAASGGYYLAVAGDVIVAQPGTLTGSIGVYTGKFVTAGTLAKLGVNIEGVSEGRHAEMYSSDRPFTDEERARVREAMQATYDQFVDRVAEARHTTPEKIDEVAQGRVWTGHQARQRGLVDELGGFYVALAAAKQRARIPADEEVDLVIYPPLRTVYELLTEQIRPSSWTRDERAAAEALMSLLGSADRRTLGALFGPGRLFNAGETLAHMPYVFTR